jgi:hypothetical protein
MLALHTTQKDTAMMPPQALYPPPWNLSGRGLILVYRLPKPWLLGHGHIPAHLESQFIGGFSALMLVDYAQSNCGAYRELLFVPGQFRSPQGNFSSISRIYVSHQASVDNGIANWGIPKEFAEFSWQRQNRLERVQVGDFAEFVFSSSGLGLPIKLHSVPAAWRTLLHPELTGRDLQPADSGKNFLTTLLGHGTIHPARLHSARANPAHFPDLEHLHPVTTVLAEPFNLIFPIPRVD